MARSARRAAQETAQEAAQEEEEFDSTRDALEAAFDAAVEEMEEVEDDEVNTPDDDSAALAAGDSAREADESAAAAAEDADAAAEAAREEADDAADQASADADAGADPAGSEAEQEPEAAGDAKSGAGAAPNAWRPEAREVWADVPEAARREIERRESDMETKLGELSERTAVANAFNEHVVEPFRQVIAIEAGGDPVLATRNLMGVVARLRMGTPQEKALVVRDIINAYGVGLDDINAILDTPAGAAPPGASTSASTGSPPPADPRLDQLWNAHQTTQQRTQADVAAETQQFIADNEFANDVREEMADLIEMAERRGQTLSLQDAYDRAIAYRPDIQRILASREAGGGNGAGNGAPAVNQQESLKRKKRAARTITSDPAAGDGSSGGEATSLRGALEQAFSNAEVD